METVYKDYIIKPALQSPSLLTVATTGRGGKIPKILEGMFTSHNEVKRIIDFYLDNKTKEV